MQSSTIELASSTNRFENLSVKEFNQFENESIIKLALESIKINFRPGVSLDDQQSARDYLQLKYVNYQHEVFSILHLDIKHRLIFHEELFYGTLNGCSVYPREVVKSALHYNSGALLLCHNHPSGDASVSNSDERITKRLKNALALIDVSILDHIVVGKSGTISLSERGLL
ncbi:MAG: JAB domain-containing protein [Pseudomonadota bacterium]